MIGMQLLAVLNLLGQAASLSEPYVVSTMGSYVLHPIYDVDKSYTTSAKAIPPVQKIYITSAKAIPPVQKLYSIIIAH